MATAFEQWQAQQRALGGSGEYGSAPAYGTTAYIGGDPSSYARLMSAEQQPSPGGNIGGAGTGAALSSQPTLVGNVAYDQNPWGNLSTQSGGGFTASNGLVRDTGMLSPGGFNASTGNNQVSAGQYGSYNAPTQTNQYTQQQANALTANSNQNLQTQLAGIGSNFQGNGSYGSNRQGIAQGTAAGMAQTGLNSTLANLYSGNYQNDVSNSQNQQQINNAQQLGLGNLGLGYQNSNNSYNLGLGNLALGQTQAGNSLALGQGQLALGNLQANQNYATAQGQLGLGYYNGANSAQNNQNNFYTAQRGQDLQSIALGSSLYGQGVNGNLGLGQGMYNTGNTAYQAPQNALNNYSNTLNQFSGLGGSSTTTGQNASNPLGGAIGGALAGGQLGNLWGNFSTGNNYNTGNNALYDANRLAAQGSTPYGL